MSPCYLGSPKGISTMTSQPAFQCFTTCLFTQSHPTLCEPMDCSIPGFPVLHHLPELAQTHIHWVGDVMQPSLPLSSPSLLPSIFPSIRVFNESVIRIRWPKYWSFSFSISPSNGYSGLVWSCSPRDSQESSPTLQLKSVNSWPLSFIYSPTLTSIHDYWKNHTLTRQTYVGKVTSLIFNRLSRLVIAFFQGASMF